MQVSNETLADLVRNWIPAQRWYAGKGRDISSLDIVERQGLADWDDMSFEHVVVRISYENGDIDNYQAPLGARRELPDRLNHALVGHTDGWHVYDALHDSDLTILLLRRIAEAKSNSASEAELTFIGVGESIDTSLSSLAMGAEQTNTSVVYGEEYVLKVFRRLAAGTNPDLEITRALAEAGSKHVIPPLGWIEGRVDGDPTTFALLQPYLRSASEGWALAVTSVRDLYAEADLHADEVGGDFAAEAERLGQATAEVHADLARAFPTVQARSPELAEIAGRMRARLLEASAVVPEVREFAPAIGAAFDALAGYRRSVQLQRIHADFHLGQALRTDYGWVLLDFEGEPAKPLAERTQPDSPLRDVAGVLRSFDYASRHLLTTMPPSTALEYRASEWAERNAGAFCDGYAAASGRDPRRERTLLRAYLLDKVVYEVMYEARHRPSWLPLPLGAMARLVGDKK